MGCDYVAGEAQKKQFLYIAAALGAVYLCWGGTYLTIRFAVETMPPFLMAGVRFGVAGLIIYVWARLTGAANPTAAECRGGAIVGLLLLIGGNGGVVWASKLVPSGVVALMVAAAPLWFVLINWRWQGSERPTQGVMAGILLGFGGITLLVADTGGLANTDRVDPVGGAVLILASFLWALGSLYSRKTTMPPNPLMANGVQMLIGAAMFVVIGFLSGEWSEVHFSAVTAKSVWSLLYLIIFGSVIGFSAYVWVLRVAEPALVSTYAFVNPVIAVLLGWAFGGEALGFKVIAATTTIIAAVVLITLNQKKQQPAKEPLCATKPCAENS